MKKLTSLLVVAAIAGIFAVGCTKPEEGDPTAKTGTEATKTTDTATTDTTKTEPGKTEAAKTGDGHEHKEGDGHDHSKDGK